MCVCLCVGGEEGGGGVCRGQIGSKRIKDSSFPEVVDVRLTVRRSLGWPHGTAKDYDNVRCHGNVYCFK